MKRYTAAFLFGVIVSAGPASLQGEEHALSDRQIGHQVHSAIVEDGSLPYCAHIVNVQAKDGKVTLKGRVDTEEQKERIKNKAAKVVGEEAVTNHIVVRD